MVDLHFWHLYLFNLLLLDIIIRGFFFASGISLIVEYGITTESIKYESTIDKYNLRLTDSKGLVSYAAFHRFNA